MKHQFVLCVLYSQISVFDTNLDMPFNEWLPHHNAQGFSWRPGSVSFGTIGNGETTVTVDFRHTVLIRENTVRAILVPFEVPENNTIEIATIVDSKAIVIESGKYALLYENAGGEDAMECYFSFIPSQIPVTAEILRADSEINPILPLLMGASPAF